MEAASKIRLCDFCSGHYDIEVLKVLLLLEVLEETGTFSFAIEVLGAIPGDQVLEVWFDHIQLLKVDIWYSFIP